MVAKVDKNRGKTMGDVESHFNYITGHHNEKKRTKEHIFTSKGLKNPRERQVSLERWQQGLDPKQDGQRRLRNCDFRLINSWKGVPNKEKVTKYAEEFLHKQFEGHQAEWACHSSQNKAGQLVYHIHFVVNPRHEISGTTFDLRKGDLIELKNLHYGLSAKYDLDLGYAPIEREKNRSPAKRSKRVKTPALHIAKEKTKQKSRWIQRNQKSIKQLEKEASRPTKKPLL